MILICVCGCNNAGKNAVAIREDRSDTTQGSGDTLHLPNSPTILSYSLSQEEYDKLPSNSKSEYDEGYADFGSEVNELAINPPKGINILKTASHVLIAGDTIINRKDLNLYDYGLIFISASGNVKIFQGGLLKQEIEKEAGTFFNGSNIASNSRTVQLSFLDSILNKQELSISQIKMYTSLDSIYYTGIYSHSTFQGDTVIDIRGKYKGLIIEYSNGLTAMYKFLFIYDPDKLHTGEEKVVYTDTDREEGDSYLFTRYKFLNDSTFETVDTLLDTRDNPHVRGKEKWRIDKSGVMRSISH
jgi:hypothetical protein